MMAGPRPPTRPYQNFGQSSGRAGDPARLAPGQPQGTPKAPQRLLLCLSASLSSLPFSSPSLFSLSLSLSLYPFLSLSLFISLSLSLLSLSLPVSLPLSVSPYLFSLPLSPSPSLSLSHPLSSLSLSLSLSLLSLSLSFSSFSLSSLFFLFSPHGLSRRAATAARSAEVEWCPRTIPFPYLNHSFYHTSGVISGSRTVLLFFDALPIKIVWSLSARIWNRDSKSVVRGCS